VQYKCPGSADNDVWHDRQFKPNLTYVLAIEKLVITHNSNCNCYLKPFDA
jgi:hypothetical protein